MNSQRDSNRSNPHHSMRHNAHLTMCCLDMLKNADSLDGTGVLERDSITSTLETSSYQNNQSNDPSPSVTISRDIDCGLPQTAQRLRIDFTPAEDDTEFVQKKCCAFWEFIHSREDLKLLMVSPTPDKYPFQNENRTEASSTPVTSSKPSRRETKAVPVEQTALSLLQFAEKKGMVELATETKISGSTCGIGSFVSSDGADNEPAVSETIKRRGSIRTSNLRAHAKKKSRAKVTALCAELDNWDKLHPKCRPICKSRRHTWNGELLDTSAELLLERKPVPECFRRYPTKVYPNSPCPLFGKSRHIVGREKYVKRPTNVVRICEAPIDICVDTPYLKLVQLAKKLGAWEMVQACCAFCNCCGCCTCSAQEYAARDAERAHARHDDMRAFDARMKQENDSLIRIMYK